MLDDAKSAIAKALPDGVPTPGRSTVRLVRRISWNVYPGFGFLHGLLTHSDVMLYRRITSVFHAVNQRTEYELNGIVELPLLSRERCPKPCVDT